MKRMILLVFLAVMLNVVLIMRQTMMRRAPDGDETVL